MTPGDLIVMVVQDTLIQSGINLLFSGMTVVFIFLLLLIVSIYTLRAIFSMTAIQHAKVDLVDEPGESPSNNKHHQIIKEVMENIRS